MSKEQIATASQAYFRYKNLVVGMIVGTIITIVLPILAKKYLVPTEGSITPVILILVGFGVLWLTTTIITFIRSGRQRNLSHTQSGKPAFTSSAGTSTQYKETRASTNVIIAENEVIQVYYAPVMRTLTADTTLLGQQTLTGEENCLILTDRQLIGILVAPADMERYNTQNRASEVLGLLPSDPSAQNMGNAYLNNRGMFETIKQMIQNDSLQEIVTNHYAISIPRSEIIRVQIKIFGGLTIKTQTLGTFHWSTVKTADMKNLLESFGAAGLPL